jgi:AcrR family transcriptional regulator
VPRSAARDPARSADTATTRDAILTTAGRVFLAHGYEGTSMDQIAAAAGVARRTLYNQFAGKKALFDATMTRLWEQMPSGAITDAADRDESPAEVLYAIGRTIVGFWAPPEAVALLRLLIWESERFPELGEDFLDKGRGPARHAVQQYVAYLADGPDFAIDDPDLAATQFIDVILGEVLLARLIATQTSALDDARSDHVVREAVALFLARYRRVTT